MKKQTFIQGTVILLAAGILNRMLGFVPRILLPRWIGAEGIGLYQMAYPPLIVLITIITGGIPLAVAKLTAEADSQGNERKVRLILKLSLTIVSVLSIAFTVFCLWAAPWITRHLLTDDRVYTAFLVMSPIIVIVSVSSVFRGYFQGRQNMIPTATSQVVETIVRSVVMLGLSVYLLPYGVEYAAAGAMAGVLVGELAGMLLLLAHYKRSAAQYAAYHKAHIGQSASLGIRRLFRRMIKLAAPVTGSKLVGSFSYMFESIMIVQSLAVAGIATAVATSQYGVLSGMVIPLLLMPSAITYSLSVSLVPALSDAAARGDYATIRKRLHQSMRLALISGAPFAVMMFVLAEPLCYYMYHDASVGSMLRFMAPVALFLYFQSPLQAALQALERPGRALLNTFVGASIKLTLIYVLAAKSGLGIYGAVIAICVNIALVTILHWQSISALTGFAMKWGDFLKVGLGMAAMGIVCRAAYVHDWISSDFVRFMAAIAAGVLLYLLIMIRAGLIDRSDVSRIPWIGKKAAGWF